MQTTLHSPPEAVTQATERLQGASDRLAHLLSFVPDDKLGWSPSPSSRTPLRIVAHCAVTNRFFADVISGTLPERMPTPVEFFAQLHAADQPYVTREAVLALLRETTAELRGAIEAVTTETIDAPRESPFGPVPARFWLDQAGEHPVGHGGQLAYLQTIWGDMDDHMG